jgi:hypothetical protein
LDLDEALAASPPPSLSRDETQVSATRGGGIRLRLVRVDVDDPIVVDLWEDEATVSAGDTKRHFELPAGPSPRSWIPDAAQYVKRLLSN